MFIEIKVCVLILFAPEHSVYCRKHRDASQDALQGRVCFTICLTAKLYG